MYKAETAGLAGVLEPFDPSPVEEVGGDLPSASSAPQEDTHTGGGEHRCLWCETEFAPHRGGSPKSFCDTKCRVAFHSAARRWAERAVKNGLLTGADLRNGRTDPCTLLVARGTPSPVSDVGRGEKRIRRAPVARRTLTLRLAIQPAAIEDLADLGWLRPSDCCDSVAIADAVVDLCDAALTERLSRDGQ